MFVVRIRHSISSTASMQDPCWAEFAIATRGRRSHLLSLAAKHSSAQRIYRVELGVCKNPK
jgi:hypothetical protein